ncbi:hypothetical protein R1sor_018947 [Riccia sorocarpa]|uniref:Uncharacterized protein n=1 Tax=Riccia sorocarpa TaxID=122646 RepID=A0ABD3IEX5_9MARC
MSSVNPVDLSDFYVPSTQFSTDLGSQVAESPIELVDATGSTSLGQTTDQGEVSRTGGRSKVTQLVPKKVWDLVYQDFLLAYPDATFAEESLKVRLREELTNEGNGKAELQSEEVLRQLKMTDGHARRNVLSERSAILSGTSNMSLPAERTISSFEASTKKRKSLTNVEKHTTASVTSKIGEESNSVSEKNPMEKLKVPESKARLLGKQSDAISRMSVDFASIAKDKTEYMAAKLFRVKLANLEKLKSIGVLNDEQFRVEAKKLYET